MLNRLRGIQDFLKCLVLKKMYRNYIRICSPGTWSDWSWQNMIMHLEKIRSIKKESLREP